MTLNQIHRRLQTICLSHNQVREYRTGMVQDFLTDKTCLYPAVFAQDSAGSLSISTKVLTVNFRLFFLDLVNASNDTKANELDVQSDMVSVAGDIVTQLNLGDYSDWRVSRDNTLQLLSEHENDLVAGCYIDISISVPFTQNACAVPSDLDISITEEINTTVNDLEYIATGAEGRTLTISALAGKKTLLVARESVSLHKVSNNPASLEYAWDNTDITLGADAQAGERFLILYRNY